MDRRRPRQTCSRAIKDRSSFFTASSGFGATDFTHPVPAGADAFARLFVAEVKARRLKVSGLFRENCDMK